MVAGPASNAKDGWADRSCVAHSEALLVEVREGLPPGNPELRSCRCVLGHEPPVLLDDFVGAPLAEVRCGARQRVRTPVGRFVATELREGTPLQRHDRGQLGSSSGKTPASTGCFCTSAIASPAVAMVMIGVSQSRTHVVLTRNATLGTELHELPVVHHQSIRRMLISPRQLCSTPPNWPSRDTCAMHSPASRRSTSSTKRSYLPTHFEPTNSS